MKVVVIGVILALGAAAALADEILLTNGNRIEGIVSSDEPKPEKITVEIGAGEVVLDAGDVVRVRKGRTRLHEYYERREKIKDSREAGDFFLLALWAKEYKCVKFVRPLCEKVIALEPDHEGARRELGHEKVGGKWMTPEEAMAARGMVRFEGRWITEAEKALIEARRLEARDRRMAALKERERRREEERLRLLQVQPVRRTGIERIGTPFPRYLWGVGGIMPMAYSRSLWNPYGYGRLPVSGVFPSIPFIGVSRGGWR